ncbi:MAG: 4Fe-4S dicluster domain-containing protein [Anaerolineales bacterium]|nr:MAG: 4Fe-4S dicluster domain-containing protein [Anaerolineales bacterium]
MSVTSNLPSFLEEVIAATSGGEALKTCLQCGTCGGSCPSGADMDFTPRALFAMIQAGMRDEVLRSNTPWYCVSCYYCTVRCPKEIPITDFMYTLKRLAVKEKLYDDSSAPDFSNSFIGYVENYGRSFELGLATRYHLTHQPLKKMSLGAFALDMFTKDRLSMRPDKIEGIDQLQAILHKAKDMEAA